MQISSKTIAAALLMGAPWILYTSCSSSPEPSGEAVASESSEATDSQHDTTGTPAETSSDQASQPESTLRVNPAKGPLGSDGPDHSHPANRLAEETSPYLLMHAYNPVDWYPWGQEALQRARKENKLIFLSIGYSSCYWCHVMERESFMDEAIAKFMNENFVCIKVDREERPDIDDIYMASLQIFLRSIGSSQGGGWPLSMFLTPTAEPIMGGTYFPPHAKAGRTGFDDILNRAHHLWGSKPKEVQKQGQQLANAVNASMRASAASATFQLDHAILDGLMATLTDQYDAQYGGFNFSEANPRMPKFPEPSNLVFLLNRVEETDEHAKQMLIGTLERMAGGGIYDHVGGGFHRYSTDRFWRVPHFEKMLYDNAQLTSIYAQTYAITSRTDFRRVVDGTMEYVLREMTDSNGGFYSALDAETDAEEGKFYVWTTDELKKSLSAEQFDLISAAYGVGEGPNFEHHHVLQWSGPADQIAELAGTSQEELVQRLDAVHEKLFAVRAVRQRPLTDTKILTAWNGLMIRGAADAGRILKNSRYVDAAARAANFVITNLRQPNGRLLRSYRDGKAKLNAYLDDYAFLVDGLIGLYQATGEKMWLEQADQLTAKQIELFWDDEEGGFFFTSHDHESLIARGKKPTDSALPSGNSVAAGNLIFLAQVLDRPDYLQRAERTFQGAATYLERAPAAMPRMATELARFLEARPRNTRKR